MQFFNRMSNNLSSRGLPHLVDSLRTAPDSFALWIRFGRGMIVFFPEIQRGSWHNFFGFEVLPLADVLPGSKSNY
ncbi:hypothetical protein EBAPG3_008990 [Nitrosospira lacus]|uniref:Uncharacterized protein n=1 Tax=Nitrosospira lacus TaxID=1288494 RepID=A0A1W6SQ41_9PROT|nr:hypothetical protein EBAPG3_008990 [Nitrosospira lacus]